MNNRKNLTIFITLLSSLIFLASCESLDNSEIQSSEKVWVFLELEKSMQSDTTDYFLYGQIKESILNKIDNNEKAKGVFLLDNIRFINNDDFLQLYEDESDQGKIFFRIEHIQTVRLLKDDPVMTYPENELHESVVNIRKNITTPNNGS